MSHHHHCSGNDSNCCGHHHHHEQGQMHEHAHCCCSHHEHGDFANKLLEMADEAWMEVLKEKIKAKVVASSGDSLDKLATIVAESNNARWQQKLALFDIAHTFADKIRGFFSSKK